MPFPCTQVLKDLGTHCHGVRELVEAPLKFPASYECSHRFSPACTSKGLISSVLRPCVGYLAHSLFCSTGAGGRIESSWATSSLLLVQRSRLQQGGTAPLEALASLSVRAPPTRACALGSTVGSWERVQPRALYAADLALARSWSWGGRVADGGGSRAWGPDLARQRFPTSRQPCRQPCTGHLRPRTPGVRAREDRQSYWPCSARPQLPQGDTHQAHLLPSLLGLHLGASRFPVRW